MAAVVAWLVHHHHHHLDAAWQIFLMFIFTSDPERFGNYTSPTW